MRFFPRRSSRRRLHQQRLSSIEQLEVRNLLSAVISVNSTADGNTRDTLLTLREAILVNNRTLAVSTLTAAEQAQVSGTPTSTDTDAIAFNIPADDPGHLYYRDNGVSGSVSIANIAITTEANDANISDMDPDWAHSWWSIKPVGPGNVNNSTSLPALSDGVEIDGYTQPGASANTNGPLLGSNAVLRIELNGLGNPRTALQSDNALGSIGIKGMVINEWGLEGIYLTSSAGGHVIAGNFVGVDVSGSLDRGNGRAGVRIDSRDSLIGGTTPADRNIISGNNLAAGVIVAGGTHHFIQGNFIGLGRDGVTAIGNAGSGIVDGNGNITVGGTTPEARNVISANQFAGISANVDILIQGNYIGIDVTGTLDRGNGSSGVSIDQLSQSRGMIGGSTAGAGNLISGNHASGINLSRGSFSTTVQGNFIGTDRTGTQAIPNRQFGIGIGGNPNGNHLIGGTMPGAGNLISGNTWDGVFIDFAGISENQILGNRIGTDVTGTLPLGNGIDGIRLENGTTNNIIGGTAAGAANIIAFNARNGVALRNSITTANSIRGNSIHNNAALGIDLSNGNSIPNGVTPNDPGDTDTDIANTGQNYPVLASAVTSGGATTIGGTLNSTANSTFLVDFYSSPVADPSGFGEGQTYLGFTTVTTDGSGNSSFSFSPATAVTAGHVISSTATDAVGNTSEFSGARPVSAPPSLSINDVSLNEGASGTTAFTFTVTLSANPTSNVNVTVNTANGTINPATIADNDYSAISNQVLTFVPNGSLTQTVTVNVNGDNKLEWDESYFVNLSNPTGATIDDGQGLGTILNDDAAPTLSFSTNNSVQEGNVTADDRKVPFTITLSAVSGVDVTGTINTTSGTATEGTDFVSADGVAFAIPAGQTQATIFVSVIEDTDVEPDEQFTITATVTDPTTVSNSNGTASGIGTILNDDIPTLSINNVSANEGSSGTTAFTFTVTLSANPTSNVTVTVNTANGTINPATTADNDYSAISNLVLTFVPNGSLTQTVTVNVNGDSKFERNETFFVNLSNATGATIADSQGLGTILNDDLAPTLSFSVNNSVLEGNVAADDRKVPFTITLSAVSGVDVTGTINTISGTATEGVDFESADGVVFSIPAGQTQATVFVNVIEDTDNEPDEQFTITATVTDLTTVSNVSGMASGTGTILNDDAPPTLSINDVSKNEGVSGSTAFTFTVTLSANPSSHVTVIVNTANGTINPATTVDNDYSAISNLVLTFVPNGPLTQTVTVNVNGDAKFERNETFFLNLSNPVGATLANGQGLGTILNDDLAPTISFNATNSVQEGNVATDDRKVPFTISLSAVSGVDVAGTISTSSGTATEGVDFESADGVAFLIPAGQTQATIFVNVIEDTDYESDEQFTITATVTDLSTVSNVNGTVSGTGTILNDDAPPTLSINNVSRNEGVSGTTAFTFTVTLSANPTSNVSVTVDTANGTTNPATTADGDYSAISNLVLTFVPNGPLTQTVTVNVNGDAKFERNETFFVNLSNPVWATIANGQGLGTILNDELAPTVSFSATNSVLEGNVAADDRKVPFTISLSAVSGVDVAGTISTTSGTATEGVDFESADGVAFLIPAGQTQATIFVNVIEDTTVEPDEQFTITATVTDQSTVSNVNGTASGTGTILNDDFAALSLSINDVSNNEGNSGTTAFAFTVTLSANPTSNVTVTVNTANGTTNPATTVDNDYTAISNQVLTFVPNGPLTKTVTVNVTGDCKFERNETFLVKLSNPTGATLANSQGLGTILNDDLAPTMSFSATNSVLEGNVTADDRKVPFTLSLSAVSGVDVAGTLSTTSGTATEGVDFVSGDGVAFLIPAGQLQTIVYVSVIEDTTVEPNEQFTITATVSDLITVRNANGTASGTGTILNDDVSNNPSAIIGGGCDGPALIINGSNADDTIRVVPKGQNAVKVLINGQNYGTFAYTSFQEIIIYGRDGNDDIELAGNINTPAFLFGEAGNDRLKGGNGPNVLVGGNDCDELIGSQSADVLIGGDGADRLVGNGGDDLLIAGWTDHDTNLAALCAILDEWSRTDVSYTTRVSHLRNGGGSNGSVRLNNLTVHNDSFIDKLTGSAGCDWFFANTNGCYLDQITDRHSAERADDI